ncbi:hypothetical protein GOV11_01395 [Candidatus Woesearchaeota archaeon]|nr:hypothetical protein [Candidatus Woesearchaeota archaeon]
MDEQLFTPPPAPPHKQARPLTTPPGVSAAVQQVASVATRLKLTEERYQNLQKRNQLSETSLLQMERDIKTELRVLTQQVVELRRTITDINSKADIMVGELSTVAKKHELAVLEKYLDMWEPTRFVTRKEAELLIKDAKYGVRKIG